MCGILYMISKKLLQNGYEAYYKFYVIVNKHDVIVDKCGVIVKKYDVIVQHLLDVCVLLRSSFYQLARLYCQQ